MQIKTSNEFHVPLSIGLTCFRVVGAVFIPQIISAKQICQCRTLFGSDRYKHEFIF
jgi:hypothetical protein